MNALSLFTGIGGLDLGIKLACTEARVVCCVERDAYCRRVLAARMADGWLDTCPVWDDVTTFDGAPWRGCVDTICGGFPCQDLSLAGRREGIKRGNRSGLWYEFARIIREVGPRFVFIENVAALLSGGIDIVLGDLAEAGYDAEWGVFRAADVGAPHLRKRLFILAHARGAGAGMAEPAAPGSRGEAAASLEPALLRQRDGTPDAEGTDASSGVLADAHGPRGRDAEPEPVRWAAAEPGGDGSPLADAEGGSEGRPAGQRSPARASAGRGSGALAHAESLAGCFPPGPGDAAGWREFLARYPEAEPAVRRDAARVPHRIHRLRALGNAVVPQQAALAWTILRRRMEDRDDV